MRLVSALLLLLASTLALLAQNDRGTITGEVKDPTGAVVPSATVVATNTASGPASKPSTTGTGTYPLPPLPACLYPRPGASAGFKKCVLPTIEVQVSISNRVHVELQVGAASDAVTVPG